jgi:hypothetical protein
MTNELDIPVTGISHGLCRFARLSRSERRLFLEAVMWLGLFRAVLLSMPFRRIASHLGAHMAQTPPRAGTPETRRIAKEVARAVSRASRHVPWEAKCLVQAMVGKKMLKRRGFESTLYLGLAKKKADQGLQAHAWLRCGDQIILGGGRLKDFAVVATFGNICHGPKR